MADATPTFEGLPVEVHANVLRFLPSLEDLGAVICASHKSLAGLQAYREQIIISVIQSELEPEIFAEYLGILHAPRFEDFSYVPEWYVSSGTFSMVSIDLHIICAASLGSMLLIIRYREPAHYRQHDEPPWAFPYNEYACQTLRWSGWMKLGRKFYKSHFINVNATRADGVQRYEVPNPRGLVLAGEDPFSEFKRSVCFILELHCTVKVFMEDFQTFAANSASRHEVPALPMPQRSALDPPVGTPLLPGEELRLHRGFLRYELYCRTEGIPVTFSEARQLAGWKRMPIIEAWRNLENLLKPWELEEIATICIYVGRVYDLVVLDVSDGFKHTIKRLSDNIRRDQSGDADSVRNLLSSSGSWFPILSENDLMKPWKTNWAGAMACSGLSLLRSVLRLGLEERRDFFSNAYYALPDMANSSIYRNIREQTPEWPCEEDEVEGANPAFRACSLNLYSENMFTGEDSWENYYVALTRLRELGWVFWEHSDRLDMLEMPDSDTEERWVGSKE